MATDNLTKTETPSSAEQHIRLATLMKYIRDTIDDRVPKTMKAQQEQGNGGAA